MPSSSLPKPPLRPPLPPPRLPLSPPKLLLPPNPEDLSSSALLFDTEPRNPVFLSPPNPPRPPPLSPPNPPRPPPLSPPNPPLPPPLSPPKPELRPPLSPPKPALLPPLPESPEPPRRPPNPPFLSLLLPPKLLLAAPKPPSELPICCLPKFLLPTSPSRVLPLLPVNLLSSDCSGHSEFDILPNLRLKLSPDRFFISTEYLSSSLFHFLKTVLKFWSSVRSSNCVMCSGDQNPCVVAIPINKYINK